MDTTDILKSSGISVGFITIVGAIIKLLQKLNNKRIHSKCNGKDVIDIVVDVREATEEEKKSTPRPSPVITAIKNPSELNLDV